MSYLKVIFIFVGAILLGFIAAGIVLSNLRFFLWVGIIGLIIYAIVGLMAARRST